MSIVQIRSFISIQISKSNFKNYIFVERKNLHSEKIWITENMDFEIFISHWYYISVKILPFLTSFHQLSILK